MASMFGCRGSSCTGCTGYSCTGGGCTGYSSCYGNSCNGCTGFSSCHGTATYYGADFGGCSGRSAGCYGSSNVSYGSIAPSVSYAAYGNRMPTTEFSTTHANPNAAPARMTIEMPADAKLFVDGNLTKGSGASRQFHTPELANGSTYFYELKAELIVDGKPVVEEKRVLVRSGDSLTESFPKLIAAAQQVKDPLASK